jgi:preprotein translocase subunit SecG
MAIITVIHCFTAILIVAVVLIQSGKGAEISASFSGSSQTVFGSSGGANFFVKFTYGAAVVFVATSLLLTRMGGETRKSLFETTPTTQPMAPAGVTGVGKGAPGTPPAAQNAAPAKNAVPAQNSAPSQNAVPAQDAAPNQEKSEEKK